MVSLSCSRSLFLTGISFPSSHLRLDTYPPLELLPGWSGAAGFFSFFFSVPARPSAYSLSGGETVEWEESGQQIPTAAAPLVNISKCEGEDTSLGKHTHGRGHLSKWHREGIKSFVYFVIERMKL